MLSNHENDNLKDVTSKVGHVKHFKLWYCINYNIATLYEDARIATALSSVSSSSSSSLPSLSSFFCLRRHSPHFPPFLGGASWMFSWLTPPRLSLHQTPSGAGSGPCPPPKALPPRPKRGKASTPAAQRGTRCVHKYIHAYIMQTWMCKRIYAYSCPVYYVCHMLQQTLHRGTFYLYSRLVPSSCVLK